MKDYLAKDFVKELKVGWNLGDTFDGWMRDSASALLPRDSASALLNDEQGWGNPHTTEEMITTVQNAGFNLFRLPVSWWRHLDDAHQIDKQWLDRVQEVVNYGIHNGMYVIVNLHHENWHFPRNENFEKAKERLVAVWRQIGERFSQYDEHLIFEAMNEPRLVGTELEWRCGDKESRDVINKLNAAFIETIRSLGGNNEIRQLMIPTYAASGDKMATADFALPEDKRVIASIHAYTPYNFALNIKEGSEIAWHAENACDKADIDALFQNLDETFLQKGIPVILGECGALHKNNLPCRVAWANYFFSQAKQYAIPCIWWDNGRFEGSGELFGLFDRRVLQFRYPEIVDAMQKAVRS